MKHLKYLLVGALWAVGGVFFVSLLFFLCWKLAHALLNLFARMNYAAHLTFSVVVLLCLFYLLGKVYVQRKEEE